jgi:hypothetical protein
MFIETLKRNWPRQKSIRLLGIYLPNEVVCLMIAQIKSIDRFL